MSILHRAGTTLSRTARRFVRNQDGNISLLFGLTLIPMLAAAGSAVDYSRASQARSQLQAAADSAVLAVARTAPTLTDAQLRTQAEQHFRAVLTSRADLAALPITVTRTAKRVQIAAAGSMPTTFMKFFGYSAMNVSTTVEAGFGDRKVELMLALDNTGSMAQLNKMVELKKATQNLINAAAAAAPAGSGMIKVGLVPFDTGVRVEPTVYGPQSWMAYSSNPASAFNDVRGRMANDQFSWGGCLTDRSVGFDTNDRRAQLALAESLHPAVICANNNLAKIQPLTDNWNALRATVNSMQPSGCTNVTIGARFGMAGLSPGDVLGAGAAPLGDANTDKYLVILTDGDNTNNRFVRTPDCNRGTGLSADIDDKTRTMCSEIKAKTTGGRADIKVFTIRVMAGNQALLRDCATNVSMYKEVNDATQIDAVFKDIIKEITAIRLTM
jgi:Putative Flp pilus-assembly TadE/G-like